MVIRVLIWIAVFNRQMLLQALIPLGLVFLATAGITFYFYKKIETKKPADGIEPKRPLNLTQALIYGLIYTTILFVVAFANDYLGAGGLYIASGISGLTDLDAISISVSKLSRGSVAETIAINAILIATISNTVLKMGIALWAGSREMRRWILLGYGIAFAAALIGFAVINL